jgi:lipid A ethanolaminephosphotransferase
MGVAAVAAERGNRAARHPLWLLGWACLWLASAGNIALWRELTQLNLLQGARGVAFGLAVGVLLFALLVIVSGLLAWRGTLKPMLTLMLIASALATHFMFTYRVVLDTSMVTNVLQTHTSEALELLSARLVGTVLVLGILPSVWIWRTPVRRLPWTRRALHNLGVICGGIVVAAAVVLVSFQPLSSAMRNHRHVRYLANPLNLVNALGQLAAQPLRRDESILLPLAEDAQLGPTYVAQARAPLLVLVLGETGRTGNFALNGYARETTPELAAENVASFRNAWACGTSTAASLPCMFSHLGRDAFEGRSVNHEGLLDVLQRAGLAVLWVDNQSGCKGVCDRIPTQATRATAGDALCTDGECFDEVLLRGLDERISALPAERRARGVVVVLHTMGSHGPAYYKRAPAQYKPFLPECTSTLLTDCTNEQLVNAYDNSIRYTDHVLASTIRWLKAHEEGSDAAMVYLSDHGESLGENNLYLHGLPYTVAPDVQKRVPWITWLSPSFERRSGVTVRCLHQLADTRLTHDHLFHSMLGLADVRTDVYRRDRDVHAACSTL